MLATLDERPFTREGWLFERKLDGESCIAFRCGDTVPAATADDPLVFAGRVGTGFDDATLARLHAVLAPLEIDDPPFTAASLRGEERPPRRPPASVAAGGGAGAERSEIHWVRPELVFVVGFVEWTFEGRLRHPRYLGHREGP